MASAADGPPRALVPSAPDHGHGHVLYAVQVCTLLQHVLTVRSGVTVVQAKIISEFADDDTFRLLKYIDKTCRHSSQYTSTHF